MLARNSSSEFAGAAPHPNPLRASQLVSTPRSAGRGSEIYTAEIGNAVTDLIFSIAKREVTFFSGTAPISFL